MCIRNISRIILVFLLLVTVLTSCEKYEDVILKVKVVDKDSKAALENIEVLVFKTKSKKLSGFETATTYSGRTDANGELSIMIEDYNPEYQYLVEANVWPNGRPVNLGGYTYSEWHGTSLENFSFSEVLTVELEKVPL